MSTDQETIFEPETPQDQVGQVPEQPAETSQDLESEYVGEGKKYASLGDALKSVDFAQEHIKRLEAENADLRKKEYKENAVDELLETIKSTKETPAQGVPNVESVDIDKLLDSKLEARAQHSIMTNNITDVDSKMKSMFGDKAKDQLVAKSRELGISIEQMQDTAAKSPNAFMAWFGGATAGDASINSDIPTETIESVGSVKQGTYNYYKKMFKENPSLRNNSKIQNEMHDNAIAMGDSFYN